MKKLVAALAAFAACTVSAFAADLPARTYTKAPVMPAPVANWTGFYIFGGAGGGIWDADTYTLDPTRGVCSLCAHQKQGGDGFFGTVGAGYDWQFNRSWVAGLFADGQFGSLKGTIQDADPYFAGQEKLRDTWAVGVRAGYLVAPNVLSYVNGGYTGSNWSRAAMYDTRTFAGTGIVGTPSFTRDGWFVGGGVENSLNIFGITAPGLFMKTEYRAAYFGGIDLADTAPGFPAGSWSSIHFKPFVQTVSTSLVYRFNWSDPVAAKSAPAYTKAPVMATNWTGFYIFGGAGGGVWDADTYTISPATGNCHICARQKQGGDGWFGTVGGGYDWQFNRSWVAGVFADGQFGSLKGTIQDQEPEWAGQEKLRNSWAAGVRAGYLVTPSVLSYVNGGYTGSSWSGTSMLNSFTVTPTGYMTPSFNRDGWFVGGGVENNLNIFGFTAPGLFMKTEYRAAYYDGIDLAETNAAGATNYIIHFKPIVQTISTSLVYRFNSGGPVVAKY